MTDVSTLELTWPARTGPLPISSLPPDQALSFFEWAEQNAGQMLNVEHERGNVTDNELADASNNPLAWWRNTPLFRALRIQAGLIPSAELIEELARTKAALADAATQREQQAQQITALTTALDDTRNTPAADNDLLNDLTAAINERDRQRALVAQLEADIETLRSGNTSDPDLAAELAAAQQHATELAARAAHAERQLQDERDRAANIAADGTADQHLADELAAARNQVDELANRVHNERLRVEQLETELDAARNDAAAVVPYDSTLVEGIRHELSTVTHELDQANLHNERLTEQITMFEADQARHQSVRGLTRIVNGGTGIVMVSVAVLVYVGGVAAAKDYAGWSLTLALLVPLAIEAGAAVEISGIVRDRRLNHTPHWSAWVLTIGLLGSSIVGMLLHATNAPPGSHHWWGYWLAAWLPIELAFLVRSALGGDKHHTSQAKT